jgi:hypothetical protein
MRMDNEGTTSTEALHWVELGCWATVAFVPLFWWVNGTIVSTDQLVARWGLTVVALSGGIAMRLTKLIGQGDNQS